MKRLFLIPFLLAFFSSWPGFGQTQRHTISGYIKEEISGEALVGASVFIKEIEKGTATNQYGFYSLTVDEGTYTLSVLYLGYKDSSLQIKLDKDLRLNFGMKRKAIEMVGVEITDQKTDQNVAGTDMGTVKLQMEEIKKLPAFLG